MPATLVEDVEHLYKTLVRLDPGEPLLLTLWNFHTYMFPTFEVTPYLWLHSPLRGWGKSNTGKLIAALSFNGSFNIAPTKAAIFREISAHSPTYIMDEADELFKDYEIRSMFKVGYKQGGHVTRAHKDGIVKYLRPARVRLATPSIPSPTRNTPSTRNAVYGH